MTDNTSERAAFEAWARERTTLSLTRHHEDPDGYFRGPTETAWIAWQAARAALTPQPLPEQVRQGVKLLRHMEGWNWAGDNAHVNAIRRLLDYVEGK